MNYAVFHKHPITIIYPASVALICTTSLIVDAALAALDNVSWPLLSIPCALTLIWTFHRLWVWRNWTVTVRDGKMIWKRGLFTPQITRLSFKFQQVRMSQSILERVLGAFTLKISGLPPLKWIDNARKMRQLIAPTTAPNRPIPAPDVSHTSNSVFVNRPMVFFISTLPEFRETTYTTVIDGECFRATDRISHPRRHQTLRPGVTPSHRPLLTSPSHENWQSVIPQMGLGILASTVIIWGLITLGLANRPELFLLTIPPLVGAVYPVVAHLSSEIKDGHLDLHPVQEAVKSSVLTLQSHWHRAIWNLMRIIDLYRAFLAFCEAFVLEGDWDPASFTHPDLQRTKCQAGIAREDGLLFAEVLRLAHIIRQRCNSQSEYLAANITCLDHVKHRVDRRTFKGIIKHISGKRSLGA